MTVDRGETQIKKTRYNIVSPRSLKTKRNVVGTLKTIRHPTDTLSLVTKLNFFFFFYPSFHPFPILDLRNHTEWFRKTRQEEVNRSGWKGVRVHGRSKDRIRWVSRLLRHTKVRRDKGKGGNGHQGSRFTEVPIGYWVEGEVG